MAKTDKTGRSKGSGRFLRLDYDLLTSPAWLSLSPAPRAVLIQVGKRYNGANNGMLAASVRDLADECRINKDTAAKALKTLQDAGFLDLVQAGSFSRKVQHAAEYRLTWERCDRTRQMPTRRFRRQQSDGGAGCAKVDQRHPDAQRERPQQPTPPGRSRCVRPQGTGPVPNKSRSSPQSGR